MYRAALLLAVAALLAACGDDAGGDATTPLTRDPDETTTTVRQVERVDVVGLMASAGCDGEVIGTQLYTFATARCSMPGGEVTLGVFNTNEARDLWVDSARAFGGTFAVGEGWAAMCENAADAEAFADAIGGTVA